MMEMVMKHPKMDFTFSPAWWRANYGINFDENFWFERYGDVGLGEENPRPRPGIEFCGHRMMAAFWGCAIVFMPDQAVRDFVTAPGRLFN